MGGNTTIFTIIVDLKEQVQELEKRVAALERQLAEQPNVDELAIQIEKHLAQRLQQVRGISE